MIRGSFDSSGSGTQAGLSSAISALSEGSAESAEAGGLLRLIRGLRLLTTLILLVTTVSSACRSGPVTSGPAPDFTLDSLNGGPITLSDLEDQVAVVDFWATWCGPCIESLDHLQQLHERYAGRDVVVLAINVGESQSEVASFVADRGYTFTVLLDRQDRVTDAYGVQGIPHTLVIDRKGEIHYVLGGPDDVEDVVRQLLQE